MHHGLVFRGAPGESATTFVQQNSILVHRCGLRLGVRAPEEAGKALANEATASKGLQGQKLTEKIEKWIWRRPRAHERP